MRRGFLLIDSNKNTLFIPEEVWSGFWSYMYKEDRDKLIRKAKPHSRQTDLQNDIKAFLAGVYQDREEGSE